jgi:D-alanyl-lipoteichoic acid acyltransferase DltB (MBOAT superfamily)
MTFTTLTFLGFLAFFFPLYWGIRNRRAQNVLIVVGSYFFYGWWDWRFCWLMLAASLLDYAVGLGLNRVARPAGRKALLAVGLSVNVGLLGCFKYFNFFADSLREAAAVVGWTIDLPTLQIVLPVGISFYTFQTMSYSIDVYRRQLRGITQLVEYLAYVSFFPQLVAGPIERATHLLPQFFRERRFDYDRAVDGCRQMLWGFFKKMVIADNIAPIVEGVFGDPAACTAGELALGTVLFAVQIYCDFSAYSEIASGLARLFGFELMRNFATPYFSQSLGEFWRRWHISLTSWFKDYVYLPLGGSRVSKLSQLRNVLVTFLLSGIWHGASWNFVLWGALNGLAVLPETLSPRRKTLHAEDTPGGDGIVPSWRTLARMSLTFGLVCVGWILFRARNLGDSLTILHRLATEAWQLEGYFLGLLRVDDGPLGYFLLAAIGALFAVEWLQRRQPHALAIAGWPQPVRWAAYSGLTVLIVLSGTFSSTQFIYFQF